MATKITESGAKLFDLLNKENDLREHREKAIAFLENISRNLESNNEQQYIEKLVIFDHFSSFSIFPIFSPISLIFHLKTVIFFCRCVRDIIQQQTDSISEMKKYLQNAEKDEKTLEEKIKKKKLDLDRADSRLKTLTNVKPAFMEEYERQERELEKLYNEYLEKFRNLDYLEHQLDIYNKQEEEKLIESQKLLDKIKKTLQEEEKKILMGEGEIDEELLEKQIREDGLKSRGQSRGDAKNPYFAIFSQ